MLMSEIKTLLPSLCQQKEVGAAAKESWRGSQNPALALSCSGVSVPRAWVGGCLTVQPLAGPAGACSPVFLAAGLGSHRWEVRGRLCVAHCLECFVSNFRGSTWSLGLSNSTSPLIRKNIL